MRSCATAQRLRARHSESKDNINWQNSIDKPLPTRYNIIRWSGTSCPVDVAELCNGSTHDSDSCCLGSNPSSAAIFASMVKRLRRRPLTAKTGVRVPMEVPRQPHVCNETCGCIFLEESANQQSQFFVNFSICRIAQGKTIQSWVLTPKRPFFRTRLIPSGASFPDTR